MSAQAQLGRPAVAASPPPGYTVSGQPLTGGISMRRLIVPVVVLSLACAVCLAEPRTPTFKKLQLTDKFYCEGAYYADFNKDGKLDVVAGPFWYEGPDFQKKHEIRPPKAFDPKDYSDNFLTYHRRFQRRRLARRPLRALARHRCLLVRESRRQAGAVEAAPGAEGRGQRIADVGRHQRRRPARADLQHDRLPGLRHLRSGQARAAVGLSPHHAQGQLPAVHARHRLRATSTATAAWTSSRPTAGGSSRPRPSPASPGSGIPSSSPRPPPRCSSTTWTATGSAT